MSDDRGTKPKAEPVDAADAPERDVVFVGGPSDDGAGVEVLRLKGDELSAGELRAVKEGQPIHGDLLRLSRRADHERLFDVEVLAEPPRAATGPRKGPAKVTSEAYRQGWDNVFSSRKDADLN